MLDLLRRNSRSTIIYLLFGVIIVVFVFTFNTTPTGQGCLGGANDYEVASVDGESVMWSDLNMAMALTPDPTGQPGQDFFFTATRFGRPDQYMGDRSQISPLETQKVMDDLVETYLVSKHAREAGMDISDAELRDAIQGRFFGADGEFVSEDYNNRVRYGLKTSISKYEEFERREALRRKFIEVFTAQINAPASLVDHYFEAMHDKVTLEYVDVNPESIASTIKVSDSEANSWASANASKIEGYYKDNEAEFNKPERVQLTGLFKRAPFPAQIERSDETRKAELQKQRDDARAAVAGHLVAVQAAENSATPPPGPATARAPQPPIQLAQNDVKPPAGAAAPAGDAAGDAAAPTGDAAAPAGDAAAPAGDSAAPAGDAAAPAGDAAAPAGDAAAPAGDAAAPTGDAAAPAGDAAAPAGDAAAPAGDAAPAAEAAPVAEPPKPAAPADVLAELAAKESDHTASKLKNGKLPEPLSAEQLKAYPFGAAVADGVFGQAVGKTSEVIEVDGGFWIVRVDEKMPAEAKTLDQARTDIARKLLQKEKAVAEAQRIADGILADLKGDKTKTISAAVDAWNEKLGTDEDNPLTAGNTPPFGRMLPGPIPRTTETHGTVPGLGKVPGLTDAAFTLTADNPVAPAVYSPEETDRKVVVRFSERTTPEEDEAKTQRDLIKNQLDNMARVQSYRSWYRDLVKKELEEADIAFSSEFNELKKAERERRKMDPVEGEQQANAQ